MLGLGAGDTSRRSRGRQLSLSLHLQPGLRNASDERLRDVGVALSPLAVVMPQEGAQGAGGDVAGEGEVLLVAGVAVFQKQGPQHVGPVLGLDLVRDDHLLHHLVGHARQGLLVQIQEHSPVGQGPAELQEAAEREGGHVGLPPALRLLLHVLLEFDPARRLPPLRLLVFVQQQLVQLHEHLVGLVRGPGPGPRRGARLSPFPATLRRPFGILPYQVSPYPRNVLEPVTFHEVKVSRGQRLGLALIRRDPGQQCLLNPRHAANAPPLLQVIAAVPGLGFGQGAPRGTPIVTSGSTTGHRRHLFHWSPSLGPIGGPGSCLLVRHWRRGRGTSRFCLPVCAFILLEKELH